LFRKPKHWPQVTAELDLTLNLLKFFRVSPVLLAPVEQQLDTRWLTEYKSSRDSAKARLDSFADTAGQVGIKVPELPELPSQENAQIALKTAVNATIERYTFIRSSPAFRGTAELFDMAIHKKKPFGHEGIFRTQSYFSPQSMICATLNFEQALLYRQMEISIRRRSTSSPI
jgi:hypothetical protein